MKSKILSNLMLFFVVVGITFSPLAVYNNAYASLRASPAWYDQNAVMTTPDWHYRVPIITGGTTVVGSTVNVDVDFNALLTSMGVSGTFDTNSPRVVRPNGTIVTIQEFNKSIYANATNATATRGNIRFLAQDAGTQTYYLYFDITQNGTKPTNPQTPINGTFEQGQGVANGGTIAGWNAPTRSNTSYDAQVRPSETVSITTDGASAAYRTESTDGTSLVGDYTYLLGSRTNNERTGSSTSATITKTITVPATNPGNLVFRYRVEGWDSNVNGNTTQYDYFAAKIISGGTTNMVGPAANNYTTYPFSSAYGTVAISGTQSGYGRYNTFDMDTAARHKQGMTVGYGSEPWFTVTQSLAAFAGQTITLSFSTFNTALYRTWVSVANVEWSLVEATLGTPQAFGADVTFPTPSTKILSGASISITAQVDAAPKSFVTANIYNAAGTAVATGIRLYNDGTHGSNAATPHLWTNNNSDPANPTYTLNVAEQSSTAWIVRAFAPDNSTSTIGASAGLIHQPSTANTPVTETTYFNVGESTFEIVGLVAMTNVKSVSIVRDPINGITNPKAIPGGEALYDIIISNTSGGSADNNSLSITDAVPANTIMFVGDLGLAGSGPIIFTDGTPTSSVSYNFVSLGAPTSGLKFSNNNAASWVYVPTPDINGYDQNVTNIKINFNGVMSPKGVGSSPNFSVKFKVKVK